MNCEQFFNTLFELKDDNLHILVWDLTTKCSSWFKNPSEASQFAAGKTNVYVGIGLSRTNRGPHRRYTINEVDGIPGFAVDIDIQDGNAHQKENLPKTLDEARSLVEGFGWDPTLIVHSGHGIQAWWLFKEPVAFESDDERQAMQNLSRRLHNTVKERAGKLNLTIDNVSDLSRILRPVGTINHKNGCEPAEVTAIRADGPQYNPEDFDTLLINYEPATCQQITLPQTNTLPEKEANPIPDKIVPIHKKIKEKTAELVFDENASPNQDAFMDLANLLIPTFWDTWTYNRHTELNDPSPSGYDMALANFAAKANWDDQEILNLLIACRRRNKQKLHFDNKQKYIRTIINARNEAQKKIDAEAIETATTFAGTEYENNQQIVQGLQAILGIKIIKIIKWVGDEYEYEVFVEIEKNGKKEIKSITMTDNEYMTQRLFDQRICNLTDQIINPCNKEKWNKARRLMARLTQTIRISKHHGFAGAVYQWIGEYLDGEPPRDANSAGEKKRPFYDYTKNKWFIDLNKFVEWAKENKHLAGKNERKKVLNAFKIIGLEAEKFSFNKPSGVRSSMRPWGVPNEIADPPTTNFQNGTNICQLKPQGKV